MAENEKEKWDEAADDHQRVFSLGLNEYNASLLRFWHEEGMIFPGCRVIDIGCGVGKYGVYLAQLGCDVTLTDISEEMLRFVSANLANVTTPWTTCCCDFNEVTGEEPVFQDGFDLSICTMSPAVHDAETVKKMSAMTAIAPMKAATRTATNPEMLTLPTERLPPNNSMTSATPNPAPLLIPKMLGPASGLRKAVCSSSPLTARAPPQSVAVMACGRRDSRMMNCHDALLLSLPIRMLTISGSGIFTEPTTRLSAKRMMVSTANPMA